jgi:rubrerythrin
MKKYDENKCRAFYQIAKSRLQKGYSDEAAFTDKPEGFSEWLKDTYPQRALKRSSSVLSTLCRNCGKTYGGTKCPYCGALLKQ